MLHSREPDVSFLRLKIHIFGHKLGSTSANPILAFRALKSVFKVNN